LTQPRQLTGTRHSQVVLIEDTTSSVTMHSQLMTVTPSYFEQLT